MPEVTVAIPFYNAEEYLEMAIKSVLCQTFDDFVLLLIDDGSTDQSLKIAQSFLSDKRVKVLSDGKNINLGNRLNQIPGLTETKFLARMDADDIMHPKRIEKQLQILKDNPDIDVLGTNVYSIDENNNVVGQRMNVSNDPLISVTTFTHPTIIAKTEWFTQNPYDVLALRTEDSELWMRTKHRFNFKATSEPLLFYREIGNNYYKKYFKGLPGVYYMLKKHKFSKIYLLFFLKYIIVSLLYLIFNFLGLEHILVQKRNKLRLMKKNYISYIQ
ncbi:glycosyltransferase family 2 protein [Chryseobacterium chendengshani]|uniref:glycosyltransferase family 2 protein n=1 Tax=Chryseobacterium sp. LJ668 TaxID=2864040 RepID=UPI001C68B7F0|nr:glycosyltransferase family 2 protein [Chryseobacterium sp. LJ668]MBW8523181.1 glycosyltransferase family 2 protein [Chryseobacterium sp. LJ668]QYK15477.1 glycosyltransferase family 2 protein [Chryseobacterium sp. LJ668]